MSHVDTFERLYNLVEQRRNADPATSYIARRFKQGTAKIAQKVGEEAVETVIAALERDKKELISESADLLFHWLMLIVDGGVTVQDIINELERREGISGLDEKAARKMLKKE